MDKTTTNEGNRTILEFIHNCPLGVISTLNTQTGHPESALIAFAETENFELIFETFRDARKYKNLQQNKQISFVTGWDLGNYITFQYEGEARELSGDEVAHYKEIFKAKDTPCTDEYIDSPRAGIFLVKPKWLRYSDYTVNPAKIIEIDF